MAQRQAGEVGGDRRLTADREAGSRRGGRSIRSMMSSQREVLRVGCADVDRMNRRIAEHFPVIGGRFRNGETSPQLCRNIRISARDGRGFNRLHSSHRF